ncbi:TadE/TadG family type IV pilus assembly protein [Methylotenera sp.]|uniref:TadE/TadG family type IV pilus assembly protein n=1 Tax=Methylotenera sp. TaxID=2051956 RepID=UPI002EDAE5F1
MKITQLKFNSRLGLAKQQGAAAIEFALLLVLLLMFVAGIVEFGRAFWYYDALTKATRDGARYLSNTRVSALVALDTATQDQAKQMVVNAATQAQVPSFTTADVTVTCEPNCDTPVYVIVAINAYPITIGGWIPIFLPVGSTTWATTLSPSTAMRYMH